MQQEMYRLINGRALKYDGKAIVKDGLVYSKPDENMLRSAGFLPMGAAVIPDYDPTTHMMRVDHYSLSDNGETIIAHYVVEELPSETAPEPTSEERIAMLEEELKAAKILLGLEV